MTKTKNKKLRELLIAYPDLPIIASVNSEVVADDGYADWYGDVKESCYVDTLWAGNEQMWSFHSTLNDKNEMLYFMDCEFPEKDTQKMTTKEIKSFIQSLPWKKYIVLTVMTPDSLLGDDDNEDIKME